MYRSVSGAGLLLTRTRALALLLAALLGAGCASDPMHHKQELQEALQRFLHAVNSANADAFVASFAEDATAFFPSAANAQRRRGSTEIRRAIEPSFAQGPRNPPAQLSDLVVTVDGDSAIASFDAVDGAMHSRRTLVLQRRQGQWKIVHLHASNVTASNP
jgi:uncharacterized protein (TIGR02246 family)